MSWLFRLMGPVTHPLITDNRDLWRYVRRVTAIAAALALALDVVQQLAFFFEGWETALRSWFLTVLNASAVAFPIAMLIGRTQRDLYRAKQQVEVLSRTDALTGMPNRRALMEQVSGPDFAVMVLAIADIDRFKSINDRHGHRSGDAVIQAVAQRMVTELAPVARVGRLGGEEFAVLAPRAAAGPLFAALSTFRERMAAMPVMVEGVPITVTISAGVAVREDSEPFDQLYAEADAALYAAKNAGRNRIACSARFQQLCAQPAGASRAAA